MNNVMKPAGLRITQANEHAPVLYDRKKMKYVRMKPLRPLRFYCFTAKNAKDSQGAQGLGIAVIPRLTRDPLLSWDCGSSPQ
jgi:hypothetical protein